MTPERLRTRVESCYQRLVALCKDLRDAPNRDEHMIEFGVLAASTNALHMVIALLDRDDAAATQQVIDELVAQGLLEVVAAPEEDS